MQPTLTIFGQRLTTNDDFMADVNITVDGKKVTAPAGTLLIEACKSAGIEVPSFCYYPNLSLQGACRMCLVKIEKMPKLKTTSMDRCGNTPPTPRKLSDDTAASAQEP